MYVLESRDTLGMVYETCLLSCEEEAPVVHALVDDSLRQPYSVVLQEAWAFSKAQNQLAHAGAGGVAMRCFQYRDAVLLRFEPRG